MEYCVDALDEPAAPRGHSRALFAVLLVRCEQATSSVATEPDLSPSDADFRG